MALHKLSTHSIFFYSPLMHLKGFYSLNKKPQLQMCLKQKPLNIWSSVSKQKLVLGGKKKKTTPSIHEVSNVYFPIENRLFASLSCWSAIYSLLPYPRPSPETETLAPFRSAVKTTGMYCYHLRFLKPGSWPLIFSPPSALCFLLCFCKSYGLKT